MIQSVLQCGTDFSGAWIKSPGSPKLETFSHKGWERDGGGADLVLVLVNSVLPWSGNWDRAEPAGRWDQ